MDFSVYGDLPLSLYAFNKLSFPQESSKNITTVQCKVITSTYRRSIQLYKSKRCVLTQFITKHYKSCENNFKNIIRLLWIRLCKDDLVRTQREGHFK